MYTIFNDISSISGHLTVVLEEILEQLDRTTNITTFDLYLTKNDVFSYNYKSGNGLGNTISHLLGTDDPRVKVILNDIDQRDFKDINFSWFILDNIDEVFAYAIPIIDYFHMLIDSLNSPYLSDLYMRIIKHSSLGHLHINLAVEKKEFISSLAESLNNKFKILN